MRRLIVDFKGIGRHQILRDYVIADAYYTVMMYRRQVYEEGLAQYAEKEPDIVRQVRLISDKAASILRQNLPSIYGRAAKSIIDVKIEENGENLRVMYFIDFSTLASDVAEILPRAVRKLIDVDKMARQYEIELQNELTESIYADYLGAETDVEKLYGVKVEITKRR